MNYVKYEFLPDVNLEENEESNMNDIEYGYLVVTEFQEGVLNNQEDEESDTDEVLGDTPCPCCRYITIPNKGDAHAYICPVCFWEIDLFINNENEPSDSNHGLSIKEGRINYNKFGAVEEELKQYCREPKETEKPIIQV